MSESKKIPVWQIIIVFCVLVFIACIIIFTFVFSQEKWKLTAEVVALISFLLIICAGFFFDQIQIGQISLLKREIEGKDALINSFQNFICNNQISNNNNVNPHFNIAAKIYTSEDNKKEQEEVLEENNKSISNREKNQRKQRMEMAQEDYISKYCKEKHIEKNSLEKNVKISGTEAVDPISIYCPVYDFYYEFGSYSEFIVFKSVVSNTYLIKFQLYIMLSKIYLYNQQTNSHNSLKLILLQDTSKKDYDYIKSLEKDFLPVCRTGLLSIEKINI